ncbi:MAG: DNA cytosine methyltransferase [Bacteriovoracia bacterium]
MSNAKAMTFIDLFCGCGGLSYGLEMAGHECLLGVDMEPSAIKSFERNHPHAKGWNGDIKKLDAKTLKKLIGTRTVDMVVGGPPCQGFSTVGKGEVADDRNQLFREFVRVVKVTQPKVILFENVTGLVAKKNASVLGQIFALFERLGYTMEARVLSAEEYGVPEVRRRTIIMGVKGLECRFPKPSHGVRGSKKVVTVREALKNLKALDGKVYNHDPKKAEVKKLADRERLKFIPAGAGIRYREDEKSYLPKKLWFDVKWDELREGRFRQTRLQRLPWDKPSPTILTARTSYYHPKEPRFLTPREAAACQGFPNDFVFEGSQTAQFRQIGNAVPPLLGRALGEEIKKLNFSRVVKLKKKSTPKVLVNNVFDYALPTHL